MIRLKNLLSNKLLSHKLNPKTFVLVLCGGFALRYIKPAFGPFFLISCVAFGLLRNYFLAPILFLPAVYLTRVRGKEFYRQANEVFLASAKKRNEKAEAFELVTEDGLNLDALYWENPILNAGRETWILWFNANGCAYQEIIDFIQIYAIDVNCSFLAFNYRGVGLSSGPLHTSADLILDGEAAMRYLINVKNVSSSNILIHGHSMGGGVGTLIRARYPDGPIINDRSFGSLETVVSDVLSKAVVLRVLVFSLIGGWFGLWFWLFFDESNKIMSLYMALGSSILNVLGFSKIFIKYFTKFLMALIGWNLNSLEAWKSIKGLKVIVAHKLDHVISYPNASLCRALSQLEGELSETKRIMLTYAGDPHCCFLSDTPEWDQIVRLARLSFQRN
eukprot:TRINITY_DN7422_c0_g1_i1.p1 TRINITY_DN7422_c0_g1~~TRINITY_DN7422_c0_g1_i1.p1  ORF type:complete len:390 (-),score=49.99 TRINITY_DN7422_c0_g1_i1:128-1297(-)